ncbi:hypothetical protein BJ508DRAFT_85710 [Ascobolus immersus RN42]|uniref:Uncharacterized protein n=1 Tax=Ascobolus immersus RN42 TaxID=1160509 RepID=A0A3N4IAR8_ASCIM|nr:hypothetical protein BJ508DRAFT_85710 [Ascobolus immersus RN42]
MQALSTIMKATAERSNNGTLQMAFAATKQPYRYPPSGFVVNLLTALNVPSRMAKRQAESDSTSDLKTTTTYMSVSLPSQNTIPAARTPTPSSTSSTSSSLAADGSTGVVNNGANPPRDIDQNGNVVPPPETPAAPSSDAYSTYSRASPGESLTLTTTS